MIGPPIPVIELRRRTIPLLQILSILRIELSSRGVEGGGGAPPDAAAAMDVEHPNCRLFLAESTIPNGANNNNNNNARLRRDAAVGSVSLRRLSLIYRPPPPPPHPHFSSLLPPLPRSVHIYPRPPSPPPPSPKKPDWGYSRASICSRATASPSLIWSYPSTKTMGISISTSSGGDTRGNRPNWGCTSTCTTGWPSSWGRDASRIATSRYSTPGRER